MDLGSLRAQVDVLSTDKAMLEERLETTSARLAEAQATLNSATRDLAGLQVCAQIRSIAHTHCLDIILLLCRLRSIDQVLQSENEYIFASLDRFFALLRSCLCGYDCVILNHLDHPQGLPLRHEELQAQARSYASKLAAAEGEIARLRSEATRLCDAAARGEGEVGELHRALGAERQRAEALRQALEEAEHGRDTAMNAARSLEVRSIGLMDKLRTWTPSS